MSLSRDAFLAIDDLTRKEVVLPNESGSVFVRALTGEELWAFVKQQEDAEETAKENKDDANKDIFARAAVYFLCDEKGNLMFKPDEFPLVNKKSKQTLQAIVEAAYELNGLTDKSVEKKESDSNNSPSPNSSTPSQYL